MKAALLLVGRPPKRLMETVWQLARFGVVGIAATAVHSVVALTYLTIAGERGSALVANVTGFGVALVVSLTGNILWVFPTSPRSKAAIGRFLGVAFAVLAVTCAISALFDYWQLDPRLSLPAVLLVAPALSYCGNRFWVFAD